MTPHGVCLTWEPLLVAETLTGNFMIWLAYLVIPIELFLVTRAAQRSQEELAGGSLATVRLFLPNDPQIQMLFAAFIFCCGTSHLLDVVTMFHPDYWLQAHWLVLTGIISLATCFIVAWEMRGGIKPEPGNLVS